MIDYPNAKINIGLNIIEQRKDGFHNLETIFYPLQLTDALEFIVTSQNETSLELSGLALDSQSKDNLVLKAYDLLTTDFDLPKLNIYLHKKIPFGAGLGGGSSDAAFMLTMLNSYFKLGLTTQQLINYAGKLGSDCAFFIENKTSFATGKGDILEKVKLDLSGFYLVLVCPSIGVSTANAYKNIIPQRPISSLKQLVKLPVKKWQGNVVNDFEKSVFKAYPAIKTIKENLLQMGAEYAAMSGSGDAVFGIFSNSPEEVEMPEYFQDFFIWLEKL